MNKGIITVCILILASVDFKVLALPTFAANDDGTISAFIDPEEYESLADDAWSMPGKRFWSPHPSDYNPLRRPVPVPRGSKRDEVPYHPLARNTAMKQQRSMGRMSDELEYPDSEFMTAKKRQTRPTTLIFRLGSWGLRRGKPSNAPPTTS